MIIKNHYLTRFHDPYLNHFVQPDTIIPDPSNPQSWNRYAYVNNNPINYSDPSGHCIEIEPGFCVREDHNSGNINIVYSTDGRFNNDVEQALANAILSGNTNYLNRIPNDAPAFMVGAAVENACKSIGLNCSEYYNISFMMLSTVILDIGNVRYPGTSYNNVPGSVRSDALGDPDCVGCGFDIWASSPSLRQNVKNTLNLIENGGPFPYTQDGNVFRNDQKLLPQFSENYYREYTVLSPGISHRGTVRLIVGQNGEIYYTTNHYHSFIRIR